jgi:hypothetical protein
MEGGDDPPKRNPLVLDLGLTIEIVDHYKRSDCGYYERCLDQAAASGWQQFHCKNCNAYVERTEDRSDLILARRLLAAIEGNN